MSNPLLSLGTQLGGAGSEPEHLAGLLSELAMQLAEALPPMSRTAAQVLEALSPGRLQEAIASVSPALMHPHCPSAAFISPKTHAHSHGVGWAAPPPASRQQSPTQQQPTASRSGPSASCGQQSVAIDLCGEQAAPDQTGHQSSAVGGPAALSVP